MRSHTAKRAKHNEVLLYGEGIDDQTFLKYLRDTYAAHKPGIVFGNAHGGDPSHLVRRVQKKLGFSDFKRKLALFDGDRGDINSVKEDLKKIGVDYVISEQCLEFELLQIHGGATENQIRRAKNSSQEAKKVLKEICNCDCSREDFEKCFPKELLDEKRTTSKWLDSLIAYIEEF